MGDCPKTLKEHSMTTGKKNLRL